MRSLQLSLITCFDDIQYSNGLIKSIRISGQKKVAHSCSKQLRSGTSLPSSILCGVFLKVDVKSKANYAPHDDVIRNEGGLPGLMVCPGGEGGEDGGPAADPDPMDVVIDKVWHIAGDLGFGGCLGFASGYAMKELGKEVAFGIGMVFAAAQALAYYGVIEIKWRVIKEKTIQAIDTDGDGKLTAQDIKIYWRKLKKVLTYNLPSGGSFAGGFALGLYYG
mmetsp:Transcript_27753/g.36375  ORF Transcript_27753/g.36375 Transcript_27753/m.36375 type:complete len:220 (-) Transcript_27753:319-978(-)